MAEWLDRLQQFALEPGASVTITRQGINLYTGYKPIDVYDIELHRKRTYITVTLDTLKDEQVSEFLRLLDWMQHGGTFEFSGLSIVREFHVSPY
ncbi:MAG: hypothetical protein LC130_26095 [Bryobacterales bacterium]|nr:hypothetical protein [Bryobacterales bacterium]